ncbi:MAG: terpene cyclase/mutase family protein [Gammaproteobacteria bacterium]|nr:terpene cyclase/mutase family protein [Gammaproteobacteria bacterium]
MNDLAIPICQFEADIFPKDFLSTSAKYILSHQAPDGAISWFEGGHIDPWDHVEAAMGLTIVGKFTAAEKAYTWLAGQQLKDGSWWAAYKNGEVHNGRRRESNFVAYIATGVWQHFVVTRNREFLQRLWPTVERALEFVLSLQTEFGDIHWAVDSQGRAEEDALITGCASIYKSLECGIHIAHSLKLVRPHWKLARHKLGLALRDKPERFDRTWESKARFSMDWFYPVLCGVIDGDAARARLQAKWDQFVVAELGCRCVNDEPWVTVAETCELIMALLAVGERTRAVELYRGLHRWRAEDGGYWTGYVYRDNAVWPEEKTTWTLGAMLLAADALTGITPASTLFTSVNLLDAPQYTQRVDHF